MSTLALYVLKYLIFMTQHTNIKKTVNICLLSFLLLMIGGITVSCERDDGVSGNVSDTTDDGGGDVIVSDGLFSVSEIMKVRFAPSNLKAGGHGFTAHQYDYGGLFGWGTGNRPSFTSTSNDDYELFYDWGNYNSGGNWRTLYEEEWQYLLFDRVNASEKYGMGFVYGVQGLILLPDNWVSVPGCEFRAGYGWWKNHYDGEQWAKMEKAGAVFLPAAGYRWGTITYEDRVRGYYWVGAPAGRPIPFANVPAVIFSGEYLGIEYCPRGQGCSVRLVENWEGN